MLSAVCAWWALDAISKYKSQPLTTHIYYTFGDQIGADENVRNNVEKVVSYFVFFKNNFDDSRVMMCQRNLPHMTKE